MQNAGIAIPTPTPMTNFLGEAEVNLNLMRDPEVFALAATLAHVEHWVFDRRGLDPEVAAQREPKLREAATLVQGLLDKLTPGQELIDLVVSLSSRRRFALMDLLEDTRPDLIVQLARFAVRMRHLSPSCAHYVHWLDIVRRAELIGRVFSQENAAGLCTALAHLKH